MRASEKIGSVLAQLPYFGSRNSEALHQPPLYSLVVMYMIVLVMPSNDSTILFLLLFSRTRLMRVDEGIGSLDPFERLIAPC